MDRFIENIAEYQLMSVMYLKSNMDRFIVHRTTWKVSPMDKFKIQYG